MSQIPRIVITGGVCAGKTTCLDVIKQHFTGLGYEVILLNEQATQIIENGFTHNLMEQYDGDEAQGFLWQKLNLDAQIRMEDLYEEYAKNLKNPLIIQDRGALDGKAFIEKSGWEKILKELSLTEDSLLERYDCVVHLETIAKEKPELYTLENNKSRRETVWDAVANDDKVMRAWQSHKNFYVIDNKTDFSKKISRAINAMEEGISLCKNIKIPKGFKAGIDKIDKKYGFGKYTKGKEEKER